MSKLTVFLIILCVTVFIGCRNREEEKVVATPSPTTKPQLKATPTPKEIPSPAAVEPSTSMGEIAEIKGDSVIIKDKLGNTNSFKLSDPETLQGLNVGDSVAINIHKLERGLINETTGIVTAIEGNNLTVEDNLASTYTFKVTDSKMLENLSVGNKVTIKLEKAEAATDTDEGMGTEGAEATPAPKTTPTPNPTITPKPQ